MVKTKIQTRSKEGLDILPSLINDEIKREKRRKEPRISKIIKIDYKNLLPIKGKLEFGTKATSYSEIENPLCLSLLIFKFLSFHCNCRNPTKFLSDIAMENLSIR